MELWQAVTAVSGAVVALVVGGGAVVGLINRPFAKLRVDISDVRTEGNKAHDAIGGNINSLGEKLERLIDESSKRLEGKIDKMSVDLTEVQKGVAHIDGAMPHIEARLGNLERQ